MGTGLEPAGPPAARDDGHPGPVWHGRADRSPRRHLAATVASAAGPYGYTISFGGSIALANERLGSPHLAGALLLMLGAVTAFVALGATAQGTLAPGAPLPTAPPTLLGGAHVPSAGLALCAVWGVDHIAGGAFGWLLTGFAATGVYLLLCAAQHAAAHALRHRS